MDGSSKLTVEDGDGFSCACYFFGWLMKPNNTKQIQADINVRTLAPRANQHRTPKAALQKQAPLKKEDASVEMA